MSYTTRGARHIFLGRRAKRGDLVRRRLVGALDRGNLDAELREGLLRGLLLGGFLRLTRAFAELLAVDHCRTAEASVVGRPLDVEDGVVDRLPAPGERLL